MNKNDLIKSIETLQKRGHSFSVNSAMMDNILDELRTAQEREKPCGYTWYGEGQIDYDGWEEPIGVCILACNGCGWTFYGDCFTYDAPGFDYKGEQVPNYCPHCGRKLGDEETAYHSRPEEG